MAKAQIENVHVDSVSGDSLAIGWTIDDDHFHVWMRAGEPEDVIYKNPAHALRGTPGAYDTRQLDRTKKVNAAIWAEVWEIVERDGMIATARQAEADKITRRRRINAMTYRGNVIEREVIAAFRAGLFSDNDDAAKLLAEYRRIDAELASLGELGLEVDGELAQ